MAVHSLYRRLYLGAVALVLGQALLIWFFIEMPPGSQLWLPIIGIFLVLVLPLFLRPLMAPLSKVILALETGVSCFKDNDYSVTIEDPHYRELSLLVETYNELSAQLRKERMTIFQRELLLDTVFQSTPEALILTNHTGSIVYSNLAARTLLNHKGKLDGLKFASLIDGMPAEILAATQAKQDGLITESIDNQQIVYDINCKEFTLNNQPHTLYLYKNLTNEISRKESDIWKQVIRLISHELNNSLAPISSLTNSAKQIIDEPEHHHMLPDIFDTISRRTQNLHEFIELYAKFARVPKPNKTRVSLGNFLEGICRIGEVRLDNQVTTEDATFDPVQIEQVLINLFKNARESGSAESDIHLQVEQQGQKLALTLFDGGPGMSQQQLQQALLPFFTTKSEGSGVGLALCNEIVSAHGGQLSLANRQPRGLAVKFTLPFADDGIA